MKYVTGSLPTTSKQMQFRDRSEHTELTYDSMMGGRQHTRKVFCMEFN